LTVNGGGGSNTLNANDSSSGSGQSYTLSRTTLTRSDSAAIGYASLSAFHVAASGNDSLTLLSPVPAASTTFNGGTGTNPLVGANVSNYWTISGVNSGKLNSVAFSNFQNLVGGNLSNTFSFASAAAGEATINGGEGSGRKTLSYSALPSTIAVTVNSATNAAPLISGGFSNIDAVTGSSDTGNTLIGPNSSNLWSITGINAGKVNTFFFSHMPNLVGGTGVDDFKFTGTSTTVLSIAGGGAPTHQGEWLDYSSLPGTSTVTVNLAAGSATNVNGGAAGAVTGIQNVIGSGTNSLTGDAQGNILIGGSGANTLLGGSGNSLLRHRRPSSTAPVPFRLLLTPGVLMGLGTMLPSG
jgi:serralysin